MSICYHKFHTSPHPTHVMTTHNITIYKLTGSKLGSGVGSNVGFSSSNLHGGNVRGLTSTVGSNVGSSVFTVGLPVGLSVPTAHVFNCLSHTQLVANLQVSLSAEVQLPLVMAGVGATVYPAISRHNVFPNESLVHSQFIASLHSFSFVDST